MGVTPIVQKTVSIMHVTDRVSFQFRNCIAARVCSNQSIVLSIEATSSHTFGSVLRGVQWNDLSVEEVLMPPGLNVAEHRHDGAQIYFVLEGNYLERQQEQTHRLS